MSIVRDFNGALHYRYGDPGGIREFYEEEMFHVRGFGFGGDVGLSPVSFARQTLGAAMAADEAAARTFSNGIRPGGFFTYEAADGKPKTLNTVEEICAGSACRRSLWGTRAPGRRCGARVSNRSCGLGQ